MSRNKRWTLRSMLHNIETAIPRQKTQINEWERDLIATANCAIWEGDTRKITSCLVRLLRSPDRERKGAYAATLAVLAG